MGGKGNEGVAGLVKQTPGAIGYVELIYALQNKIDYGSVQNMAGEFVALIARLGDGRGGRRGKARCPPDFRVSITNAPGKGVYPISSFTWLLFYENPKDKERAKIMVDFMKWALTRRPEVLQGPRIRSAARSRRQRSRWRRSKKIKSLDRRSETR